MTIALTRKREEGLGEELARESGEEKELQKSKLTTTETTTSQKPER